MRILTQDGKTYVTIKNQTLTVIENTSYNPSTYMVLVTYTTSENVVLGCYTTLKQAKEELMAIATQEIEYNAAKLRAQQYIPLNPIGDVLGQESKSIKRIQDCKFLAIYTMAPDKGE